MSVIVREKTTSPFAVSGIAEMVRAQKKYAALFETRIARGRSALCTLRRMITENESAFLSALKEDLGKSSIEAFASEIAVTLNEIDFLIHYQQRYLRDRKLRMLPGINSYISLRPYCSVLVMSPWNYPFQLALLPAAGALATGNGCVLKPSEFALTTSGLLSTLVGKYFSPEVFSVVEGDGSVAAALLEYDWDFIFFTGSERIGSIVAERAAKLRIPSILELGGKCPCIVDAGSVNEVTARRIVWGKFFNAGQTCVAPDYVLVEDSAAPALLKEMKKQLIAMYGEDPQQSGDYGRIIGNRHFSRLRSMLEDGTVYHGGRMDENRLYMAPTILTEPEMDSALMSEEIFGPILPILTWSDKEALLEELGSRPDPLVTYAFCKDKDLIRKLGSNLRSGAFCLNTVLEHVAKLELPFGGIGNSGYGRYHGAASFTAFTWQKVIYHTSQGFDFKLKYPPYQDKHMKWVRRFRKWLP